MAKRKRPKQPRSVVQATGAKRPKRLPLPASKTLSWAFKLCDEDSTDWPWDFDHFLDALSQFRALEGMTWDEAAGGKKVKDIPIGSIDAAAERRLRTLNLDDYESLWEVRLQGKPRFWGVRDGAVLYFIWSDPEHTVCPSALRNT